MSEPAPSPLISPPSSPQRGGELMDLPGGLLRVFKEWPEGALLKEHPWLTELQPTGGLSRYPLSRAAFYEDGFAFIDALKWYLSSLKWQYFLFSYMARGSADGSAAILVRLLCELSANLRASALKEPPKHADYSAISSMVIVQSKISPGEYESHGAFFDALKRQGPLAGDFLSTPFYCTFHVDRMTEAICAKTRSNKALVESTIRSLERKAADLNTLLPEDMVFSETSLGSGLDASDFFSSGYISLWSRTGLILGALASLIVIDVHRVGEGNIVRRLKAAVSSAGLATRHMLAKLEAQAVTINQQQQIITALQFRHLLEQMPLASPATHPRRKGPGSSTPNWQSFWDDAIEAAYDQHYSPNPAAKPTPLAVAMDRAGLFRAAATKARATRQLQLAWLKSDSWIGRRGRDLYGNLSHAIHGYSSAQFSVDNTKWGPQDAEILNLLKPDEANIVAGEVKFDLEHNRHIV